DNENTSSTEYFNATRAKFTEDYSKNMTSNQRLTGNFRIEWKPDTTTMPSLPVSPLRKAVHRRIAMRAITSCSTD
ncbi:MAG: hypothetical protein J6Q22_11610, partial [Prevotella sp.]|nr:hypothetical protein [Prevotella sp.]